MHTCTEVALSNLVATDNTSAGLAFDSYRISVAGGIFARNFLGINFQGNLPIAEGESGYGHHTLSGVQVYGNTRDYEMASTAGWVGVVLDLTGAGSPEGVVRATKGSTYHDFDTGDLYIKTEFTPGASGTTGMTGWKLVTRET